MTESHSTVGYDFLASRSLCLFPCNQPLWVFYMSPEIRRQCARVLPSFITSTCSQTSHCPQSSSRYSILNLWILFQLVLISQLKPCYSARLVISDPPLRSFYSWLYTEIAFEFYGCESWYFPAAQRSHPSSACHRLWSLDQDKQSFGITSQLSHGGILNPKGPSMHVIPAVLLYWVLLPIAGSPYVNRSWNKCQNKYSLC